jgi:hypothetical protein
MNCCMSAAIPDVIVRLTRETTESSGGALEKSAGTGFAMGTTNTAPPAAVWRASSAEWAWARAVAGGSIPIEARRLIVRSRLSMTSV